MADFKTALEALSRGDLKLEVLTAKIEKLLQKSPQLAGTVLAEMTRCYEGGQIDAQTYARLKRCIRDASGASQTVAPTTEVPEEQQKTVIAGATDATQVLTEADRSQIAEEDRAATQFTQRTQQTNSVDFDLSGPSSPTGQSWPTAGTGATGTGWGKPPAEAEPSAPLGPGSVIKERFQLDEVLGVGGMGTVFKGRDLLKVEARDRNPYVALKILNEDFKKHPDSFIALQREASRQQRLAHPNIATVYDFDRTGSTVFITMELLEGTPLNTFIKKEVKQKGGLPFTEAYPMIFGLGQALIYAHERQIVHSDFKPGNCFITKDGNMKVLDFGIARAVKNPGQGDGEKTLFDPGKLGALTPAYASAEMLEGLDPDPRDDIYALACVAYELLTGRHPFNKLPANTARDNKLVPAPIKGLKRRQMKGLAKGLAFNRENRSQTVQEFLEELEGKTNPFKNPFVVAAAVLLIIALIAIQPVTSYLHKRKLDNMIAELKSGDEATINRVIDSLPSMEPEDRKTVTGEARESVIGFYENKINRLVDASKKKYDYPGAELVLAKMQKLYPDSASVLKISDRVEESKNQLLSQLTEQFNDDLSNGRLLPNAKGEDITDVLKVVAQVDPKHPLLSDPRLLSAYSSQTDKSIDSGDLKRAEALLKAGLAMAPKNANLINLRDKLDFVRQREQQGAMVADLEKAIGEKAAAISSLDELKPLQSDISRLATLKPDSTTLSQLAEKVKPLAAKQIDDDIKQRNWNQADTFVAAYGDLLKSLQLGDQIERLENARTGYIQQVDSLVANLSQAVADNRLGPPASPNATDLLAQLEKIAPNNPRTAQSRTQVAQAYLTQARLARANGKWEDARKQVALAKELKPGSSLEQSLDNELQAISQAEEQSKSKLAKEEMERLQKERQAKLEALYKQFDDKLAQMQISADSASNVFDILNRVEAINPTDPLIAQGREKVATKLADGALKIGESGKWDQGIQIIQNSLALIPESKQLADAMTKLEAGQKQALAQAKQQQIEQAKDKVKQLLADATLDRSWEGDLRKVLGQLQPLLPSNDQWLQQTRNSIADLYVKKADQTKDAKRFTEALALLDRGEKFSPGLNAIQAERDAVRAAEQAFEKAQQQQAKQAEIDGLKQTLLTQAKAKQVTSAKQTLDQLKKELPADDPFLTKNAPDAIADAYYRLATGKADGRDYSAALKFAKAGLEYAPDMQRLKKAVQDYTTEGNIADLRRTFSSDKSFDVASLQQRVQQIKAAAPDRYKDVEKNLAEALAKRLESLKKSDAALANKLLDDGKQVLPGNTLLAKLGPFKAAAAPKPSVYADALQKAIDGGKLTEAQKILAKAESAEPNQPAIQDLKKALAGKTKEAAAAFAAYQAAVKAKKTTSAKQALAKAQKIWIDNPDYASAQKQLLAMAKPGAKVTPPSEAVKPAIKRFAGGRPCIDEYAGYGSRRQGTCFDMVGDRARGPYMVVIPAGGPIQKPFAIGKYEVSIYDYNIYCRLSGACKAITGKDPRLPLTDITLKDAEAYAKWLSERTGKTYRLPTDAEWVYAAKAGGRQPKKDWNCRVTQGDSVLKGQAALSVNSGRPNGWGLYNYVGNVQEWVTNGSSVLARGGAFNDAFSNCDISLKRSSNGSADDYTGFRLVEEISG